MENSEHKNSGWPGFFQGNSPPAWFVAIAGFLFSGYLVVQDPDKPAYVHHQKTSHFSKNA